MKNGAWVNSKAHVVDKKTTGYKAIWDDLNVIKLNISHKINQYGNYNIQIITPLPPKKTQNCNNINTMIACFITPSVFPYFVEILTFK